MKAFNSNKISFDINDYNEFLRHIIYKSLMNYEGGEEKIFPLIFFFTYTSFF